MRADPTTCEELLMPPDKSASSTKAPRRAAGLRSDLLAQRKKVSARRADLLKQQAENYDRLLKLPDGNRRIPKAEVQVILEWLGAVPMPDRSHDVTWFAPGQKIGDELSSAGRFVSYMGSSLDIMPVSMRPFESWRRDRAALNDDAERVAKDAWCVIVRQGHDRRRRKVE